MEIQKNGFLSMEQLKDRYLTSTKNNTAEAGSGENGKISFRDVLEQKKPETEKELRFSKHAAVRLKDRGIELSADQMERLSGGIRKAQMKGIRDSLVIVDELAFIVNVPNQTVVTAISSNEAGENVFTNINGAVIN